MGEGEGLEEVVDAVRLLRLLQHPRHILHVGMEVDLCLPIFDLLPCQLAARTQGKEHYSGSGG